MTGKKKKSKKDKEEKYTEIFKVEKDGKTKIVKKDLSNVDSLEKKPSKKQVENENKILRNIFISLVVIFALMIIVYVLINSASSYNYRGVNFKTVKFCDTKPCLVVYQTSFPTITNRQKADYNFYLRTNPKEFESVPFDGEMNLINNI